MGRISTKVNLGKLRGSQIVTNKGGVKGIFIPIEENNLFMNEEKGNVYLDLISFPLKQPFENSKDTHNTKQSLPQDKQREDDPFLGGAIDWDNAWGSNTSASVVSDAVVVDDDDSEIPF